MADHVEGPLYYERMGRTGPVMAFVHPNPMDQSCWIFQMAHLSTWFRCIAIDIPGYGRSPKATPGLTMSDMAQACWEAIDDAMPGEPAILVGCSVGSAITPYMYHLRPQKTAALVLSGTGYSPNKEHAPKRIAGYTAGGIDYRWDFTFEDLSPAFRPSPLAHYFAQIFTEILILDEATSSLDSMAETFVQNTLRLLGEESKTVIVIAHRLSTISMAQRVIILDKGTVVQDGTLAEFR